MTGEKKTMNPMGKIISVVLLIIGSVITLASVAFLGVKPDERDIFLLGVVLIIWGAHKISEEKRMSDKK